MKPDERAFNKLTGRNISRRRKSLGMKQAWLAAMLGVHQSHISRLERGEAGFSLYDYQRIKEALNRVEVEGFQSFTINERIQKSA